MMSPTTGGSTLMTSAPRSPSSCPANGPAMNAPSSSTRNPASGVSLTGDKVPCGRATPGRAEPREPWIWFRATREARMDFAPSDRSEALKAKLVEFDNEVVRPAEPIYRGQREESGDPHFPPPV